MQTPLTFFIAFVAVLVLIGLVAWLVRRFAGNRLGGSAGRGRMPRLAVIDAAAVDGRRRLVLVRRDNVEHLLMIGGPSDIVVEQNIVRAAPARDQVATRPDTPARLNPFPDEDTASSVEPAEPSLPEPPARPARPSFADELRRPAAPPPPPPLPERRHDPLATISSEPVTRPEPRPDLRAPRNEPLLPRPPLRPADSPAAVKAPPVRPTEPVVTASPPPPPPPDLATADQNLAEMAKRLEAALRRPSPSGEARPAAATEPTAGTPPPAPEAPPVRTAPRVSVEPAPSGSATPAPEVAPPTRPKGDFENLEDEMASLLGRPKTPS
jgi:flagellar biogenesis protein FliO